MDGAVENSPAMDVDALLGSVIRDKRLWAGMTQQQLAEKSGVSFQQVQKYETGANRVSVSRLFLIAAALNLKPSDLLAQIEGAQSDMSSEETSGLPASLQFAKTKTARRAIRSLAAIDDKDLLGVLANLITTLEKDRQST